MASVSGVHLQRLVFFYYEVVGGFKVVRNMHNIFILLSKLYEQWNICVERRYGRRGDEAGF
jgi:hypothetical protein